MYLLTTIQNLRKWKTKGNIYNKSPTLISYALSWGELIAGTSASGRSPPAKGLDSASLACTTTSLIVKASSGNLSLAGGYTSSFPHFASGMRESRAVIRVKRGSSGGTEPGISQISSGKKIFSTFLRSESVGTTARSKATPQDIAM